MDLLSSIMKDMTAPPSASQQQRDQRKKAQEAARRAEERQRLEAQKFRKGVEVRIDRFLKGCEEDPTAAPSQSGGCRRRCLEFEPMSKVQRGVVHDVSEVAGLVAHSFGQEDVDRRTFVWRQDSPPCEDELACLRDGRAWDPVLNARLKLEQREEEERRLQDEERRRKADGKKGAAAFVPAKADYKEKYHHLLGDMGEVVVETQANRNFGMVSAESKKDRRTVEEVQMELRLKKKRRAAAAAEGQGVVGDDEEEAPAKK